MSEITQAVGAPLERPVRVSPLNLSGLLADWHGNEKPNTKTDKKRKSAREVIHWACPVCGETFDEDEEKEAEACCQGKALTTRKRRARSANRTTSTTERRRTAACGRTSTR